jgi:AraC-like DNA-binding protein
LKNVISSIWQTEGVTNFSIEHIIPKGVIEIIFNFSEGVPILAMLDNKTYTLSKCFINGFNTAPIQIHLPARQIFFGVQFHPFAIKKIFKLPAREFTDNVVDMTLVDSTFNSLWHQLAEQSNFHQRVAVICHWLKNVFTRCEPQETVVNRFLSVIHQHDITVKELANAVCYSPRQLARRMIEATGMNTEGILLYKKYLHAVHLIHHTELALTNIAYQSHFADQSHFIKSFRYFTNMTPGDYRASKGYVKGHIYKNVR